MDELVTVDKLKQLLPSRKNLITDDIVELINRAATEPEFQGEQLTQTLTTYESVMVKHKASIKDYINAIRFCSYLISQDDNYTEAYKRTFIDRDFVKDRVNAATSSAAYSELTSAASRYRKSKLVTDILTLSQVPLDLMFMGARYKAVGVLATLMETAKLDRDKINAAKELLAATKGPENMKIELDVGIKESSATENLMSQLAVMAAKQKTLLEAGVNTLDQFGAMRVKDDDVIEGECV
jgi:hypothetical protein